MADARPRRHEPADGRLRNRGAAGRRGDHHEGPVPVATSADRKVTLYHAADCRLCEQALAVVRAARDELGFALEVVDIGGDAELESRYREHLPVVEIDGRRAFTYFVEPEALRDRLARPPEPG